MVLIFCKTENIGGSGEGEGGDGAFNLRSYWLFTFIYFNVFVCKCWSATISSCMLFVCMCMCLCVFVCKCVFVCVSVFVSFFFSSEMFRQPLVWQKNHKLGNKLHCFEDQQTMGMNISLFWMKYILRSTVFFFLLFCTSVCLLNLANIVQALSIFFSPRPNTKSWKCPNVCEPH